MESAELFVTTKSVVPPSLTSERTVAPFPMAAFSFPLAQRRGSVGSVQRDWKTTHVPAASVTPDSSQPTILSVSGRIWERPPMNLIVRRPVLPTTSAKCTHSMTGRTPKIPTCASSSMVEAFKSQWSLASIVPLVLPTARPTKLARLQSSPTEHTPNTSLQKRTRQSLWWLEIETVSVTSASSQSEEGVTMVTTTMWEVEEVVTWRLRLFNFPPTVLC